RPSERPLGAIPAVGLLRGVEPGKSANGRPAVVVDENVGLGAGGEQRGLAVGRAHVGCDRRHLRVGRAADSVRRRLQPSLVATVDHDLAARLRQSHGTGTAEPGARCAHAGPAAGNSQIHYVSSSRYGARYHRAFRKASPDFLLSAIARMIVPKRDAFSSYRHRQAAIVNALSSALSSK